jgi:hypothetical protein
MPDSVRLESCIRHAQSTLVGRGELVRPNCV